MSKKNKIVYSDIQPNVKEAGVWVNTTDGNVKVEKDGKWVDDGGSGSGGDNKFALYYDYGIIDNFPELKGNDFFEFEPGMTWAQWLTSDYNTIFDKKSYDGTYVYLMRNGTYLNIQDGYTFSGVSNADPIVNKAYSVQMDA